MKRAEQLYKELKQASRQLEKATRIAKTELEIDGVIQRFEFTFELFWKWLKLYLEDEGIFCASPRACLKEAYQARLLKNEPMWLDMLADRNSSVHIYSKKISRGIFKSIKRSYANALAKALSDITKPRRHQNK